MINDLHKQTRGKSAATYCFIPHRQ